MFAYFQPSCKADARRGARPQRGANAPDYGMAYLKRSKNDADEAGAICKAVTRLSMRSVTMKTKEQQIALMRCPTRTLGQADKVEVASGCGSRPVLNEFEQGSMNVRNDVVPRARLLLPKQADSRVPRAVFAIEHPTPVGDGR
jgi:hypothetical protein